MLPRIVRLFPADTRAPHAFVQAVLLKLLGKFEAALREVTSFFRTAEREIADRGDDLEFWRERAKRDVKPHLIVPRARRTVRQRARADREGMLNHVLGLADPLRTD